MDSSLQTDELTDLRARVRCLEDEAEIYRLICSWGLAADIGDGAAAGSLWTDDGVLQAEDSEVAGREAVSAMIDSDGQQDLVRQGCAHVQGYPVVKVDGDQATATNYSQVYLHSDTGYGIWRVTANHWQFRRTPQGWRVKRRTAHVIDGGPEAQRLLASRFTGPDPA